MHLQSANAAIPELVGVYIYGLFLEGCAWSNKDGKLVDSEPKKLFHPLPVVYVTGVQVLSCAAVELFSLEYRNCFRQPIRTTLIGVSCCCHKISD